MTKSNTPEAAELQSGRGELLATPAALPPSDAAITPTQQLPSRLSELLATAAALSPLGATIPSVQQLTGLSRAEIYRLLASGKLCAVKRGVRTLLLWESITAYLVSLPPAIFRDPRASEEPGA